MEKKKVRVMVMLLGTGLLGLFSGCGNRKFAEESLATSVRVEDEKLPGGIHDGPVLYIGEDISSPGVTNDETVSQNQTMEDNISDSIHQTNVNRNTQLIALADTKEQAEEIADLYGIELLSYDLGIAVYSTEEEVSAVLKRGEENGYPQLSLNDQMNYYTY